MTTSKLEQELLDITGLKPHKPGDDRQAFLLKLTKMVDSADEESWKRLSKAACEWQYDAVEIADETARNPAQMRAIPDFPDLRPAPVAAAAVENKPEETDPMPRIAIASRKNGKIPPKPVHEIQARSTAAARRALKPAERRALDERRYAARMAEKAVAKPKGAKVAKPAKVKSVKGKSREHKLNLNAVPETAMMAVIKNPAIENKDLFALVDQKTKTTRRSPELKPQSVHAIGYNARKTLELVKHLRKTNKNLDIDRR